MKKVCNLQAIEVLYQYYKDDRTMEKIEKNLKVIGEDLNIQKNPLENPWLSEIDI